MEGPGEVSKGNKGSDTRADVNGAEGRWRVGRLRHVDRAAESSLDACDSGLARF